VAETNKKNDGFFAFFGSKKIGARRQLKDAGVPRGDAVQAAKDFIAAQAKKKK